MLPRRRATPARQWPARARATSSAMPTDGEQRRAPRLDRVEAPALTSASIARRLTTRLSMRRQKSKRSRNGPPALRASTIASIAACARALHAAEAVADALAVDGLEAVVRRVDVGRQEREALRERVVAEDAHLVGVVHHERQVRRHERGRMVRLEIRRLIRHERIRRRMRLVEAVARELLHQVEEQRGLGLGHAVLRGAFDEDGPVRGHLLGLLLAHRAAQQVGAAQRVAADLLRDLHHLFLVHHHAVGRRQDRLEARVRDTPRARGRTCARRSRG